MLDPSSYLSQASDVASKEWRLRRWFGRGGQGGGGGSKGHRKCSVVTFW